jgi:hypothetical protein
MRAMPRRRLNTESIESKVSDARLSQHLAARRGYIDAAAGRGFCDWYDTAGKDEQLAYEIGRQWVTDLRAAKLDVPPWRDHGAPPEAVRRANVVARERGEGYATPWGVLADTDDPVTLEPLGVRIRNKHGRRRR